MGLFELSKEQTLIQHEVRKFTKTVIEPIERDLDDGKADLNEIYRQVVELGFAGSLIPEEFEGAGLDMISFCLVLEEIARSCASLSLILLVNNGLNGVFLLKSDHKEKQALLKKIAQGAVSGFVIPPDFDENVPDLKMIDNRLFIDATKFQLILNGNNPEFLIMPFIQPYKISIYLIKPSDKIKYTPISTLGMKIAGISEIHISGLELSKDQELIRGQDKKNYQKMLNTFRIGLAAI